MNKEMKILVGTKLCKRCGGFHVKQPVLIGSIKIPYVICNDSHKRVAVSLRKKNPFHVEIERGNESAIKLLHNYIGY